ncbi:uncharacterized protein EAF02_003372 [Botrytis sinoallii]|uniref:uncharacterized protein n=1 Tax=Botrytis sinoallii TaxID=1463999 RepID=UPI0018FF31DA|nr:uncharacterized protein EAF02_003372 [Botrytis sinoallii]KAF7886725.1 hypothetical protein EAF02_003372 [Botrytis sinoallii]
MSFSYSLPKFEQARKFYGEGQSASRWLERIKLDIASSNCGTIPIKVYLWAIYVLLGGTAAAWCDSVPAIKKILDNYDIADASETEWLERELIKRFPGDVTSTPVARIVTRRRSYSLDVRADSDATALKLGELFIGGRPRSRNQGPETYQASEGHRGFSYHDDRNPRRETRQEAVEQNVLNEYQFYNRPRVASRSPEYQNEPRRSSSTINRTPPAPKKYHNDRMKMPTPLKGILKNKTDHNQKPITHSHDDRDRSRDRYTRKPSPHQSNRNANHYRNAEIPESRQHPKKNPPDSAYRSSESRPVYQQSKTSYREITIESSKSQIPRWSYMPLPATRIVSYPAPEPNHFEDSPLQYPRRAEPSSGAWKTSHSAFDTLEQRFHDSSRTRR